MKKRTLGLIIAGVAATSMIGTGFAAWVITANASDSVEAQFTVDTVSDKGVTLTAATGANEEINFLGALDTNVSSPWLTYAHTNEKVEDLTAALNMDFGIGSSIDLAATTITFRLDVLDGTTDSNTKFTSAVTAGLVEQPKIAITSLSDINLTAGTDVVVHFSDLGITTVGDHSLAATIEFGWGAAFNNTNPYSFYNTFAYDDGYKLVDLTPTALEGSDTEVGKIQNHAKTSLEALNTDLVGLKFKLTITVAAA